MSYINDSKIRKIIKAALAEDVGRGDITSQLLFAQGKNVKAVIFSGDEGIVCGINIAWMVFKLCDNKVRFIPKAKEGNRVRRGQIIAKIYGRALSILSAERVALNFLGLLSGIATRTDQFVSKTKKYNVKIMDTRKTTPGLRDLEKYAVRIGGGNNHRFGLDEMILIKDNHLNAYGISSPASHIKEIAKYVKERKPKNARLEIEVKNLREFKGALKAKPDIIMLDNMKIENIRKAVIIRRKFQDRKHKISLEASGNINLKNVSIYAQSGVDIISLGTLTKDISSLDFSLEIK